MVQWQVCRAEVRGWEKEPQEEKCRVCEVLWLQSNILNSQHSTCATYPCRRAPELMRETVATSGVWIRPKGFGFTLKLINQLLLSIFFGTKDFWMSVLALFQLSFETKGQIQFENLLQRVEVPMLTIQHHLPYRNL